MTMGIDIQSDYLSRIFNMFYRATMQSDGAGIRLFIVKETLEKLKGTITVDEGTLFIVTIPNGIQKQTESAKIKVIKN